MYVWGGPTKSPLFVCENEENLTDLKVKIKAIVESLLQDPSMFLVDVVIKGLDGGMQKVLVLLDGDQGINIDDCASISRQLGGIMEEQELMSSAYRLEVSSPGLDHPLMSARQYKKNMGRRVRVTLPDGNRWEGKLTDVTEEDFEVAVEKKVEKKQTLTPTRWAYTDISKTMVLVSFN
ncbi:MAG TPA: ribosome maturation factor RimP [Cytophagales bacterium]|nr:ribosome maturation factor RimP [Cytophagales bacterium]